MGEASGWTQRGERRSAVRDGTDAVVVLDDSARLVDVVASVVTRTPGWCLHRGDRLEHIAKADHIPLILRDGTVAGVVERLGTSMRNADGDDAVTAALTLFAALVEAERTGMVAVADAAAARREALQDHLTGLLNRRGWERALAQEEARAARRPAAWVVAVIDVDGLKGTNDRHGHLEGDLLLRLAADSIAAAVRTNDIVARIGGDEFAVLGLDFAPPQADPLIDRIRRGLDGAGVAASVGAQVHDVGGTLADTFHLADSAMYVEKARRQGREVTASLS